MAKRVSGRILNPKHMNGLVMGLTTKVHADLRQQWL